MTSHRSTMVREVESTHRTTISDETLDSKSEKSTT